MSVENDDPFNGLLRKYWLNLSQPTKKSEWGFAKEEARRLGVPTKEFRTSSRDHQNIPATYSAVLRERGFRVSPTTIRNCRRLYRLGGVAALIDPRCQRRKQVDLTPLIPFLNLSRNAWNLDSRREYKLFGPRFFTAYALTQIQATQGGQTVCEFFVAEQSLRPELLPTLPPKVHCNAEKVIIDQH